MGLMGVYFYETGDREIAEQYYEMLQELAPNYPITKRLKRKLFPNIIGRALRRLAGK
jgi:hypothetical protein